MDKKGKLATLLFIGVTILPLLGLLIMDYQLKRANDLTGAYIAGGASAYAADSVSFGVVILAVLAFVVVLLIFSKVRHSTLISTMPLAKINKDIKDIDEKLKKKIPKEAGVDAS